MENDPSYRHMDRDTLEAMTVLLNLPAVWEKKELIMKRESEKEEYDMCQAVIEWEAEAKRIGREEGRTVTLIELINLKLRKSKEPEQIAEELEEPLENVKQICEVIFRCGLEVDAVEIYEQLQSGTYNEGQ